MYHHQKQNKIIIELVPLLNFTSDCSILHDFSEFHNHNNDMGCRASPKEKFPFFPEKDVHFLPSPPHEYLGPLCLFKIH